jgi:hypothetical protein
MFLSVYRMSDSLYVAIQRMIGSQTKSTVLRGLASFMTACGLLSLLAYRNSNSAWLGLVFGIFAALGAISFLVAYWYFAITNPDLLRTERYAIQKYAMEKGYVGDSTTGFMKIPLDDPLRLPPPGARKEGDSV